MPANKYALLRYRIIDGCISNKYKPYPTKEELRQACEDHLYGSSGEVISESTIEKDLWAMRNETDLGYNAPIAYHSGQRGYYYTDPDYTIKDIALRDEEVNAIRFAAQVLYQFKGIEPFNQFEKAIEKIMNKVSIPHMAGDHSDTSAIQFEAAPGDMGSEHLGTLLDAIQRKVQVRIRYQKFTADKPQDYILNPLLLKEYRNRWYLIAFREERDMIQSFGLERMRSLDLTTDEFIPPADFDPEHYFSKSIGITAFDAKPQQVRFKASSVSARYIETQPIHHSQKVLKSDKDWTTFQIEVLITEELIMYFLSLGAHVFVESPKVLSDEIAQRLEKSRSLYSSVTVRST